jgi:hypothetical protein
METNVFIMEALNRALEGLTKEELKWQPGPESNSIGFILWHMIRVEDGGIQSWLQQKPQIWETDNWYEKLNLEDRIEDDGWNYTADQVAAFPVPELKDLVDYATTVRLNTTEFIRNMTPDKFAKVIKTSLGDLTTGQVIALFLCEITQHIGHIGYIRGLQRGINK